jgi:hypothetical protein
LRRHLVALLPVLALPALGCVSDEAIRRVVITPLGAAPSCYLVHEKLEGRGADRRKAEEQLRKRAARAGANYVVIAENDKRGWDPIQAQMAPWTFGNIVIVHGDAYGCPAAAVNP